MTAKGISALAVTASAFVIVSGTITYAGLSAVSQLFGRTLVAGSNPEQVALTFDDGPNPAATPRLLEVLAARRVRATFFMIGRHVRRHPALAREIQAAGHVIGNHTMTHPWLAWQNAARVRAELGDCSRAIEDAIGAPVRLFRPPHGARRPYVLRAARELGLTTVQWNVIAQDWKTADAAIILARVERGIGRNQRKGWASNVVLHDGDGGSIASADRLATVDATRELLERAKGSSRKFVTPEDWLGGPVDDGH